MADLTHKTSAETKKKAAQTFLSGFLFLLQARSTS
jgi:hypothetical protein